MMRPDVCRVLLGLAVAAAAAREPRRRPAGLLAGHTRGGPGPRLHVTSSTLAVSEDDVDMRPASNITTTLKFTAKDIFESEDPIGIIKQRSMTMGKEIEEFPRHLEEMWRSNADVLHTLLPGLKLRTSSTHVLPAVLLSAVLWLGFYFAELYRDDHVEHRFPEWEPRGDALKPQVAPSALDCADVVLVFHHPDFEHPDHGQQVPVAVLRDALMCDKARSTEDAERVSDLFCNFKAFLESGAGDRDSDLESLEEPPPRLIRKETIAREVSNRAIAAGHRAAGVMNRATGGAINRAIGLAGGKVMIDARIALLQDMFECLPTRGFDVSIFSSVDSDELFLTISLNRRQWVSHYLSESNLEFQITHSVVKALGVGQDPRDPNSSPPFIPYNEHMVKQMHSHGIIATEDERSLYRTWHDRNPQGSLLSSQERINIILEGLQANLDLDVAKDIGLLAQWYPAHSQAWIHTLRETWADGWSSLKFVQPVSLLNDYFGSQVAFNFAWQGLYCKGLVALSVVAVVVEMLKALPPVLVGVTIINVRVMLPFSLVLAIWARLMANLWEREEEYFTHRWDLHVGKITRVQRPSFRGELYQSDVDDTLMDDRMSWGEAFRRKSFSMCVTLSCCCFVMCVISTWIYTHGGDMDLASNLALSLFIKISEFCYNALSTNLAQFENHKYEDSFHDSWVWLQFLFQAINSYWAVVSIAINQLWSGRCVNELCLQRLKEQTTLLMLILLSCSVAFSAIELALVRVSLELEDRNLKRQLGREEAMKRASQRSFLEEQAKYRSFETKEQIENTLQLVLALGYVLLFGTLQPLVVPLCLVHFAVTLRVRAALLTRYAKRCVPHKLVGIGAWKRVVYILMNTGIFFSGFLLVYWGRFFKGGALVAKLTGMILWFIVVHGLWFVVDLFVPTTSGDLSVLERRRRHVERIVMEASMHKHMGANLSARSARSLMSLESVADSVASAHEQLITQRSRRLGHIRQLGRTTGDEDVAPDDERCARLVAARQWSSIPMFVCEVAERTKTSDGPAKEA
mmetsp:Transcript_105633/g.294888  ORF Transcript_105633/g.294888 Transcript_105633/m.294888 type:complete len:1028 (+) Transcript_105633:160-3243(+)